MYHVYEYVILHKILYVFYNLRSSEVFNHIIASDIHKYINDYIENHREIDKFDIMIDLLLHNQTINNIYINNIYNNVFELVDKCNDVSLHQYLIKCCEKSLFDIKSYDKKKKIKTILFFNYYCLPNCIKIINNTNIDIFILFSFNVHFKFDKKKIVIKDDIQNKYDVLTLTEINNAHNVTTFITSIIKSKQNYYINLYDNNLIYMSVLYKQKNIYHINLNKIKQHKTDLLNTDIFTIKNHKRVKITEQLLFKNIYLLQ